jgi:type VI secretion system protein ImpK
MRDENANVVYPVLLRALEIAKRLGDGETLSFEVEQAALRTMLLSELEARRLPEYGGDAEPISYRPATAGAAARQRFLGIRYALACWLDELFLNHTTWDALWNEQKLEMELYGTNDRSWKFWEQAQLAEKRTANDALEAFFLCAELGFRGDLAGEPAKLEAWLTSVRTQLARAQSQPWIAPPEREPQTNVPPLRGRNRLQKMLLVGGVLLLLLIPVLTLFLMLQLRS